MKDADLRDQLALQSPPMELSDVRDIMGWDNDLEIGDARDEFGSWRDTVCSRWAALPVATRLAALAKFSYIYADEMLKARGR